MSCTHKSPNQYGTGVAEAIGNWGFSNGISSKGNELQRIKNICTEMDSL